MVNRLITCSILLMMGITGSVLANSQGSPFSGNKEETIEKAPTRYFVKYLDGQVDEARKAITEYGLNIVDELPNDQVFVIEGESKHVEKLMQSSSIEYTEPEPIRKLLAQ
ncbi:ATPase [Vibrio sp. Hep-1b-8]|uniref:ATPase n=1 Tax=Vibrio sp. Hep-1b-8 TaxID=2144187 RepID=UPI001110E457|nr:ATPase [Vibrio sp. Hep-1b-8]TMX35865.1 ATPase [Vibrio sp. Hep-1b-8]